MYIVGMNGPPRVGKDTIGKLLQQHVQLTHPDFLCVVFSLSEAMGRQAAALLDVPYSEEWYESQKDQFQPIFGMTLRQFIIANSEQFMKPVCGNEIWVRIAFERLYNIGCNPPEHGLVIVTNFGFPHEPTMFEDQYGEENVLTCQVTRADKSFHGDSRGYVQGKHLTMIHNDGALDDAKTEAIRLYGRLVNQMGWQF